MTPSDPLRADTEDGLREAFHRDRDGCNGRPHRRWYRGENKCEHLAALARSIPAGLDVDRLAKVLAIVQPTIYHVQDKDWRPNAERIAAEYARLRDKEPTDAR